MKYYSDYRELHHINSDTKLKWPGYLKKNEEL